MNSEISSFRDFYSEIYVGIHWKDDRIQQTCFSVCIYFQSGFTRKLRNLNIKLGTNFLECVFGGSSEKLKDLLCIKNEVILIQPNLRPIKPWNLLLLENNWRLMGEVLHVRKFILAWPSYSSHSISCYRKMYPSIGQRVTKSFSKSQRRA